MIIGQVYGEDIHYARSKLGLSKTIADDIRYNIYGSVSEEVKTQAGKIIDNINVYLDVLQKIQKDVVESPHPQPIDINNLLKRIIEVKRISKLIKIVLEFGVELPIISAPRRQLEQIFFVIIQNAIDAMSEGVGVLKIITKLVP